MQIAVLLRELFPWHTSDNVPLVHRGVDCFHAFTFTVKDHNLS